MTERQKKIVSILRGSEEDSTAPTKKQTPLTVIILGVIVISILATFFATRALYSPVEGPAPAPAEARQTPPVAEAKQPPPAVDTAKENALETERRVYAEKLEIRNMRVNNMNGEIKVSGSIVNTGNREVDDIGLTVYCLDASDRPVCEQKLTASSPDNEPLRRYQRRRFTTTIDNWPDTAKEVEVIVGNIEFAN